MQTVETGGVRHVEHLICHRSMVLLVLTIIASPALGESPFHDSECALSASSEMAQPLEVATRALPRSPLQPIAGTFPPMRIAKPCQLRSKERCNLETCSRSAKPALKWWWCRRANLQWGRLRLRKAAIPMSGLGAEWRLQPSSLLVDLRSLSMNGMDASPKAVVRDIDPQIGVGGAGVSLSSIFGGRMPGPTRDGSRKGPFG